MAESAGEDLGRSGTPGARLERFGDRELDPELAREALLAAGAGEGLTAGRGTLGSLAESEKAELVDRTVLRLGLYVLDLPASEAHHHRRPYGLLEHLVGVARGTVERLGAPGKVGSLPRPAGPEREAWLYGAWVAGLVHDLGKVFDLEVGPPDGSVRWDPLAEPLAAFYARRGVRQSPLEWRRYRKGRGLAGHALRVPALLGFVLPSSAAEFLGPRLWALSDALILESLGARLSHVPPEALEVARVVREVDIEQSRADRKGRGARAAALGERLSDRGTERAISEALEEAVREDLLPLNRPGGLYVLSEALLLEVPGSLDLLLGRTGGALRGGAGGSPAGEREELLGRLAAAGLLPLSGRSGRSVELGVLQAPGVPAREGAWLVLRRELLPAALPRFGGTIRLEGAGGALRDPGPDVAELPPRGEPASARERLPGPREASSWETPEPAPHPPEAVRSDPELYERRIHLELGSGTLAEALEAAVLSGLFVRNSLTGDVFHREGCFFFRMPGALDRILRRKGISPEPRVRERALRELARLGALGPAEVLVRFHPESRTPERALRLPAPAIVFPGELRERIGEWPHPIEILSGAPSEAAGNGDSGDLGKGSPAADLDRRGARGLPLALFTKIYEAFWDLSRMQAIASARVLALAEEFRARMPPRRLVLFPKRDGRGREVYALFWGRTVPGPGSGPRRIHHLAGPLTEDRIEAWGDRRERAAYHEFERRRLALNRAYHVARKVPARILESLDVRRDLPERSASGALPLPPLPPPELLADLSPVGLRSVRLGARLAGELAGALGELRAHREACAGSPFRDHLALVARDDPERGQVGSSWVRLGGVPYEGALSTRRLRTLQLPLRFHAAVMAAEMTRRRLEKAAGGPAELYRRILGEAAQAWREAAGLLSESRS